MPRFNVQKHTFSFPNATMDHCLAGPWADTVVRPSDDSYIYDVPMSSMQK